MDVTIEDQLIVDNLDVAAVTGGTYRAYVVTTLPVYVSDGAMTISLTSSLGTVMISGLEVMASANLVTHRINSGSTSNTLVTMNSVTWSKDTHALSGAVSNRCAANNSTNSIYCSSRYFRTSIGTPLRYQIPVPYNNALYALRLHFNEHVSTVRHLDVAGPCARRCPTHIYVYIFLWRRWTHKNVVSYSHWRTSV